MKNIEIENKYLLSYCNTLDFLNSLENYDSKKITQFYIYMYKDSVKRIRKIGNKYIFTFKKGNGKIRQEYEKYISKKTFHKLSKKTVGEKIKKTRYFFTIDHHHFELDIFKGRLKGLAYLEIEFSNEKEMDNFILPAQLENLIIKDVSQDNNYTNSSLAIAFHKSKKTAKILKKIGKLKRKNKFNIKNIDDISIYNYLRIFLYYHLIMLKKYKKLMQKRDKNEDLHQFRINLRKIRSNVNTFTELFDADIYEKIQKSLKEIGVATNQKRDLDVFITKLKKTKENYFEFYNFLEVEQKNAKKYLKNTLNSPWVENLIFDLEILLQDDSDFYTTRLANLPFKKYAFAKVKQKIKKTQNARNKLNAKSPIEDFHAIRIRIKKLRYLLDAFPKISKTRKIENTKKSLKKYQSFFGNLNDLKNQIFILENYISKNNLNENNLNLLLEKLNKELFHQKKIILEQK